MFFIPLKAFKYQDIKKVYTIVFLEKSTKEFHQFSDTYIHHSKQTFDTGLNLNLLQEFTFIALDIFRKTYQNKNMSRCMTCIGIWGCYEAIFKRVGRVR